MGPSHRTPAVVAAMAFICAFASGTCAQAQAETQSEPVPAENTAQRSFPPDYFAPFNPVTAEDMVRRVPGFTIDDGAERRGFAGTAGNVLINGERPSSKDPISEQLSRIAARDVAGIDLYSGGADSAGASGQTLYVDVRLRPRDTGATSTFVLQFSQLDPSGSINPLIVGTRAFRAGPVDFNLAIQAQPSRRGRIETVEEVFEPDQTLRERREGYLQGSYWEYRLSAAGTWAASPRDTVRFNTQFTPSQNGRHTLLQVDDALGDPLRVETSNVTGDDAWSGELGGDWERQLSDRASFKLIGLAGGSADGSSEIYSTNRVNGSFVNTYIERATETREYIGRGVWTFAATPEHAIEASGELAFNSLDSTLGIMRDIGGGPFLVPVPNADTRVEEQRAEVALADAWRARDNLRIEASLAVETSTITQSRDGARERDFTYVKPRLHSTWTTADTGEFRLLLERDVAQLDFADFATSISQFDGTVDAGNSNLEPERTWRVRGEWERRFGEKGALVLAVFHDEVEAVQDQVPITGASGQFDGPGNLGDGRRSGIELNATAPLDALGLSGAELRLQGVAQETRVDDPVTGAPRRFSDEPDWTGSIDFRQALPARNLVWGVNYEDADAVDLFRLAELRSTGFIDPHIDLFIETTAIRPFVIRFTASDILQPSDIRERRFFEPDRTDPANLESIAVRDAIGAYGTRSYGVRISGRF
ncbi:MAG: hypothetical protein PVI23_01485 [Maricaulaceae bacterium]|jgi:hypothetical protein